jgi:hypothetical protein
MKTIFHQLKHTPVYTPDWRTCHLFLGTFNPTGGDKVNYYYGRDRNQTWKIISEIFKDRFNPSDTKSFFPLLKKQRIACMDMIDAIEAPETQIQHVIGIGYKDSAIINTTVRRAYNTALILEVIAENPGIRVYSTWGNGSSLREWQVEVAKLGQITPLVSPSLAARVPKGESKFDFMLRDWAQKIEIKDC